MTHQTAIQMVVTNITKTHQDQPFKVANKLDQCLLIIPNNNSSNNSQANISKELGLKFHQSDQIFMLPPTFPHRIMVPTIQDLKT